MTVHFGRCGATYGSLMREQSHGRFGPGPIVTIHVLAAIGILFWLSMVVQAFATGASNALIVLLLAIVLGGAHLAIWVWTSRHSSRAIWAMWFILIGDSLLTLLVDVKAIILVIATIVLLLLARTASARAWYSAP